MFWLTLAAGYRVCLVLYILPDNVAKTSFFPGIGGPLETLLKKYARAKRLELVCGVIMLLAIMSTMEVLTQASTWIHGPYHLPLRQGETKALFVLLFTGVVSVFTLSHTTFKVIWPLEAKIYQEEIARKVRAQVDEEMQLFTERQEWLRKKAIYAAKRRRERFGHD